MRMADATKESEARAALRRYIMLKSVLVKPVRGGGGRWNRNINMTEKLMISFYKGEEDQVWKTALEIERRRQEKRALQQKKRRKRNLKGDVIERKDDKGEARRRGERAKVLTNDGELRKAFATMVQRGVAPTTKDVIKQLRTKFPPRKNIVSWPSKCRIDELRNLVEKSVVRMDVDECEEMEEEHLDKSWAKVNPRREITFGGSTLEIGCS